MSNKAAVLLPFCDRVCVWKNMRFFYYCPCNKLGNAPKDMQLDVDLKRKAYFQRTTENVRGSSRTSSRRRRSATPIPTLTPTSLGPSPQGAVWSRKLPLRSVSALNKQPYLKATVTMRTNLR